jgi:uncharacterized LabA/DUF88 family protein
MTPLRLAILIDADNVSACNIHVLMEAASKLGCVKTCRAYGDWKHSPLLRSWKAQLLQRSDVEQVQQDVHKPGKNTTDIGIVIDAMELMHSGEYDGFCIASSDSDFTSLALKLKDNGFRVYGFGVKQTLKPLVKACDRFYFFEDLQKQKFAKLVAARKAEQAPVVSLLHRAVNDFADKNGWAALSEVGKKVTKKTVRKYGFGRISDLLRALPFFELRVDPQPSGMGGAMFVRWAGNCQGA